MYQFFVEPSQIQGTRIVITGNDVNHIKNVLRMQPGEEIAVSNGEDGKEYRCGIEELYEDEIICTLRFVKEDGVELPSKIYLFQFQIFIFFIKIHTVDPYSKWSMRACAVFRSGIS